MNNTMAKPIMLRVAIIALFMLKNFGLCAMQPSDLVEVHEDVSAADSMRSFKSKKFCNLTVCRVAEIANLFVNHSGTVAGGLRVYGPTHLTDVTASGLTTLNNVDINGTLDVTSGNIAVQSLKLFEDPANGTDFITLQAPASLAATYPLVLPPNIGLANQVLKTDGSGNSFWGASTSACNNVLTVKNGTLSGPDEFNSVTAAMASITTNTPTNRFIISICPGVYIEDTIIMKSYVALAGTSALATIIEVDSPNKDAIIGASDSSVEFLTIRGATDPGQAAIAYSGGSTGGDFIVSNCIFGSSDILLKQTATTPFFSLMTVKNCVVDGLSNFSTGISVTSGPFVSALFLDSFSWIVVSNPILSEVMFFSGPQTYVVARNITIGGSLVPLAGDGIVLQDGATLTLADANIIGFNRALFLPNVGAGPLLEVAATLGFSNTEDVRIDNPLLTGSINATMARDKTFIDPATVISLLLLDPTAGGTTTVGELFVGDSVGTVTDISPQIQQGSNMGVIFGGGALTVGGVGVVDVGAGTGYLMTGTFPTDDLKYVAWGAQSVAVIANTDNYIFIDDAGVAQSSAAPPTLTGKIFIGKARTDAGNNIVYIQEVDREATHTASQLDDSWRQGLGNIYVAGSIVSASATPPQLDVSNGRYFMGTHEYVPMGGADISFITFSRGGANFNIFGPQQNVPFAYDSAPNTLTPLVAGQYARHALYVVGDGVDETYILQYGQQAFASLIAAQAGGIPPQPGSWTDNIVLIASIIVDSTSIVEIRDERPRLAFRASGVTVVTDHGSLTGLLNDDHPQYLLVNGVRAMIGNLDMGTNAVFNATTYNGVTVEAHASRHLPISGADPLPTQTPLDIGTANSIGIQNTFSRGDHIHAHANQPGGSLHALVTPNPGGVAGFMSAADKTKLDGLGSASYVTDAGTAAPVAGVLNVLGGTNIGTTGVGNTVTIDLTGTVAVGNGGTGATTFTTNGVLYGNGTSALQVTAAGAANTVLLGNGGAPSFGAVPNAALVNSSITLNNGNNITVTGSPVSLGGAASFNLTGTTNHAVQVGNASGSLTSLATGSTGQLLQSAGAGADPAWTTSTYPSTNAQGDLIFGSAANVFSTLAKNTTATRYLANTGASNNPNWDQVNLTNGVTGVLPNANTTATTSNTANTIVLRDVSGYFSPSTKYTAVAYRATTDQSLAATGTVTIEYNTEVFDPNSNFTVSTGAGVDAFYTAPATGYYAVNVDTSINVNGNQDRLTFIEKDTGGGYAAVTAYSLEAASGATAPTMTLASIILLNSGDKIRIRYTGRVSDALVFNNTSIHIMFLAYS